MITPFQVALPAAPRTTVMAAWYNHFFVHESSTGVRIALIVLMAVLAQVAVKLLRFLSEWLLVKSRDQKGPLGLSSQKPKFVTMTRLTVSGINFAIYFAAVGLILQEFGFSLTAYLASASVVGLAISFGSQGLVQDIVIGLTLIFWDAMAVNDMVEIAGTDTIVIGRVQEIGMRFTKLVNFFNQTVFVPNRTIGNVSRFPQGGVDAYADPQIPNGADAQEVARIVENIAIGMWTQFAAIILAEPVIGKVALAERGSWSYVRVHFKIWPGQGSLIDTTFRQQVVKAMKTLGSEIRGLAGAGHLPGRPELTSAESPAAQQAGRGRRARRTRDCKLSGCRPAGP